MNMKERKKKYFNAMLAISANFASKLFVIFFLNE